jgi:hypothetical protein
MKKTIAVILVAVIASLACPTVFAHGISHFPTKAEIEAASHQKNQSSSFWDKIAELWHGVFG